MLALEKQMDSLSSKLSALESDTRNWAKSSDVSANDLPDLLEQVKAFVDEQFPSMQLLVDQVNESAAKMTTSSNGVLVTHPHLNRVEGLNNQWKQVVNVSMERSRSIEQSVIDHATNQQAFLSCATEPPFERAVAANRVPYYINHATESTHWDHPKTTELMNSLSEFNEVRFSAYRTGLKLRTVQKRLCLDLVSIEDLMALFDQHGLRAQNDKLISVPEMISCLQNIFEGAAIDHSSLVNIPLSIDLCLNWLLNLYDTATRTGFIRVLSFKIGLVALCKATLEDKYKRESILLLVNREE